MARMVATSIKPSREILAEKLHELFHGLPRGSKSRFAEKCRVHPSVVTRWLDGDGNIDAGTIDIIAETVHLTQSELFDENVKIDPELVFHK